MAGRCVLNAEIVVQVHGREPELWSIGRMADRLSAGTGSIPVSSAISLREIRPAARTLASRSSYEGSSPSSPAKREHGIAAGASGLQPDDASSTLAARSMIVRKSSSGQDATLPTSRARVRVPPSAPGFGSRRCSQDSKASACKADHRECNSPHRLQIVARKFCAGVAQWEERGPRKSVIGVRIAAPAPLV